MKEKQNLERISHQYDSYIKRTIRNCKYDYIRKNKERWENETYLEDLPFGKKEVLLKDDSYSNDEVAYLVNDRIVTNEKIHKAIDLLPGKKSIVINLHYFGHYSDKKIAEMLGITQEGVSKRKRTALKLLGELIEELIYAEGI